MLTTAWVNKKKTEAFSMLINKRKYKTADLFPF
jgi:hypothetical protein